ncbi:GGDEF domain-containing protein [Demequina soli]|uniref:GGDEF domain-containing protein n=1 Tax=Demequina soli TaxID=1638987 RepID=UPI00078421FF|nr:sensor domain-containing diguanylate cyclase [Demequina soli]
MDPLTLRVALASVATTLLVLSYAGVYRRTRSRYSAWWSLSLVASASSTALYLCNGTPLQVVANPTANGIAVLGVSFTWAAARSLRGRPAPWWMLAVGPVIAWVLGVADDPAHDIWTGGAANLGGMAVMFTMTTAEARRVLADRAALDAPLPGDRAIRLLTATSGALAAIYWLRLVLFVTVGPDARLFVTLVGTVPATLALIVALVVVTFTMTELAEVERTHQLRLQATLDPLTGLLNRAEFESRAVARLARTRTRHAVVFADLDHFKAINDTHGHETGDRALAAFADACRQVLRRDDVVGRMGGEEFVILMATDDPADARTSVERLRGAYAGLVARIGVPEATVSYGIAVVAESDDLAQALRRADAAMYRAKRAGRDRAVLDGAGAGDDAASGGALPLT